MFGIPKNVYRIKTHGIKTVVYEGGPKNNEKFFLEGRGALLPPAPAWCVYVTALRISWPSGVLEERAIGSV
jgi:hypothetical protein